MSTSASGTDRVQTDEMREQVRSRYARAALAVDDTAGCCGGSGGCGTAADTASAGDGFGAELYDADTRTELPASAVEASLGCGNPVAVADLRTGETVLDLGSGGGIDVLLSARRVGPTGFAYGIDMTDEMLELARRNQIEAGIDNVEFRRGLIEDIPLDDASIDVVISNCVVNLSVDKSAVFSEIARVLRPGGRIGITDVVTDDDLSPEVRAERGSWVGCIAGALSFEEYHRGLSAAGFVDVDISPTHSVAEGVHSAIVRAVKPALG